MLKVYQLVGQLAFFTAICALVGALASWPRYQQIPEGTAQIKLSLAHAAQRKEKCRRLSPKEIAKLPPNERRPNTCKRERVPIHIQLLIDGEQVYDAMVDPVGLSRDGRARVYEKFNVPVGRHKITVRLKDTPGAGGFDYEKSTEVDLKQYQNLAIDFSADKGGFVFF